MLGMIKKIREWLDKRAERKFKENINREYLTRLMINVLTPSDWGIEIKQYTINKNKFVDIYNFEALKRFVEEGGIILFIEDENLYKKVKYLNKRKIRYLITEDKQGIKYNKKEINYGF